jgi:ribose 5-phosphate isomerase B
MERELGKRSMKIFLASDHAGVRIKEKIKDYLERKRFAYQDLGTDSTESVDYPDFAIKVANKVVKNNHYRGILICGTGTGMVIAANKVKGIRAVAACDTYSAKMSRVDNDTNILALRGRFFPFEKIRRIISVWLNTPFSGEQRHRRRLKKIAQYEEEK